MMTLKVCPKCKANFVDGKLHWVYSGKKGSEIDLASLVCRPYGDNQCINPMRDTPGGDTWEARRAFIDNTPFGGSL
jgi:hypothetical protein